MASETTRRHGTNRKKWCDSGIPLVDMGCVNASLSLYGGVWSVAQRKFFNKAWVYSQQYRVLLAYLEKGFFTYPCPTDWTKWIMEKRGLT